MKGKLNMGAFSATQGAACTELPDTCDFNTDL